MGFTTLGLLAGPAKADTTVLTGSQWLNGQGVNVMSGGDGSNNYVTVNGQPVLSGSKWQCVELINRLYLTRGWITANWYGNGGGSLGMYNYAPSNLTKELNGSITYLSPGDVVALDGGSDGNGHVAIINSISGNTVQLVNQNTQSVYGTSTYSNGSLTSWLGSGYTVKGVIHAPSSVSSIRIAYVDTSGNAWIKDGGIGATYTEIWDHSVSTAADIQLSPNRIAIRDTSGALWVSQYPSISWVEETTGVSAGNYRIVDGNIAVLQSGTLSIKQGTGSGGLTSAWHSDATNVSNFKMAQNGNVAATFTDGTIWSQWGGYGGSWVELTGGWIPYDISNGDVAIVNGGELYVMVGAPGSHSWNAAMANATGVQLAAGGNLAGTDTSGYLNVAWGGYGSTWTSQVANSYTSYQLTDTQIGVLYGNSLNVKEGTASGGWTLVADNAVSFALS